MGSFHAASVKIASSMPHRENNLKRLQPMVGRCFLEMVLRWRRRFLDQAAGDAAEMLNRENAQGHAYRLAAPAAMHYIEAAFCARTRKI
jgi:hypothetical protein